MYYQLANTLGTGETAPDGAIEITRQRYTELLNAVRQGKNINVIDGASVIYSGDTKTVYQLDGDEILQQILPIEHETPTGWVNEKPISLSFLKTQKSAEIDLAYQAAEAATVEVLGYTWFGGKSSAAAIEEAKRFAEGAGETQAEIFDVTGTWHMLPLADIQTVYVAIGIEARNNKKKHTNYQFALAAATTEADVNAITVDFS
jgi:hypothetical protein